MMGKLTIQSNNLGRPFKPYIYQRKRRGQGKNNYYDRGRQQSRFRSNSRDRFPSLSYRGRPQYKENVEEETLEEISEDVLENKRISEVGIGVTS